VNVVGDPTTLSYFDFCSKGESFLTLVVFFAEHSLATDLLVDVAFGVEHYQGVGLSEVAVNYGDMAMAFGLTVFSRG